MSDTHARAQSSRELATDSLHVERALRTGSLYIELDVTRKYHVSLWTNHISLAPLI